MRSEIEQNWQTDISAPFRNCIHTVDGAVYCRDKHRLLLGKKAGEAGWRFPGGFVDITDKNLEDAVKREVKEECGINLEVGPAYYIGNERLDDPRYYNDKNRITTTLFLLPYVWGKPQAGDDLANVEWFDIDTVRSYSEANGLHIEKVHRPLITLFLCNYKRILKQNNIHDDKY